MLGKKWHFTIYFWMTCIFAFGITWSRFMTSFPIYFLFFHWILEGNFKEKISTLKTRVSIWLYTSPFLLFSASLLFTNDYTNLGDNVMSWLPIFVLPLVFGTSPPFNEKQLKWIIYIFIYCLFATAIFNTVRYAIFFDEIHDYRNISYFLNHIRYSLLINLAVFLGYYFLFLKKAQNKTEWVLLAFAVLYLLFFLFLLQSLTGIAILFFVSLFECFRQIFITNNAVKRRLLLLVVGLILSIVSYAIVTEAMIFFSYKKIDVATIEKTTKNGNEYSHNVDSYHVENGNYVELYICVKELEESWKKRSLIPLLEGKDENGQQILYTLFRYMTSKGLRKDAEGLSKLTDRDIINIEKGFTNYRFTNKISYKERLNDIFWQIHIYFNGADPSTHSVIQRLEFAYCAISAIKENPWFGVGAGAMRSTLDHHYEKINTKLSSLHRKTPHNQYLSFLMQYGIIGLSIFLLSLLIATKRENKFSHYPYFVFLLIFLISMINEDTLTTQLGVAFYAFFGSLLLFTPYSKYSPQQVGYYSLIDLWNLFKVIFFSKKN